MRNNMGDKICTNCKQEKNVSNFHKGSGADGLNCYCKKCVAEYAIKNRESVLKSKRAYNTRQREKTAEDRKAKKEKRILEAPFKKELARKKRLEQQKTRNAVYPEIKKLCDKKYREKTKSQRNEKDKLRKAIDPQYRLTVNLRIRLNKAIENDQKIGSAIDDLGCSIDFLKNYLESLFQYGMTWDNYGKGSGKWQIDHIKALCLFNLTNRSELLEAVNYKNLQPIWYEDHMFKTQQDIVKSKAAQL